MTTDGATVRILRCTPTGGSRCSGWSRSQAGLAAAAGFVWAVWFIDPSRNVLAVVEPKPSA